MEKIPITGKEELTTNMPFNALVDFYKSFNSRDALTMENNWSNLDDIAMDNPLGGIKRGWQHIKTVYENIFNGEAVVYVEFYDYTIHEHEDLFYAVGRERGTFTIHNDKLELEIRTSRIFRKEEGIWKQVHHHGSIEDPLLLQMYQDHVKNK